ncbi:MAG: hypothetical protein EA001_14565 [Oscillatoriales cyanobacterium]|nr:MAG: hypothetical protein EA001_14565 [Oscillatoriales cyanobacterium]
MKFRPARPQPARSETEPTLHRRLSLALECVELDLEAELARYRRQRGPRQGIVRRFFLKPPERWGEPPMLASAEALEASGALVPQPPPDNSDLAAALVQQKRSASPRLLTAAEELGQDAPLAAKSVVQAAMLLEDLQPQGQGDDGWARRRVRRRQEPAWTGVGVATILVMLSGTIWTYYNNYPDSDSWLKVGGLLERTGRAIGLNQPARAPGETSVATIAPDPEVAALPSPPPGVNLDLTRDEFADLSLENLAVLGDRPPARSETIGSAAIAPATTNQPAPRPLPFPQAQRAPAPAAASPAASPNAVRGVWYVVGPYSGPASLIAARKLVADAYVREFPIGRRIQFGALNNPTQANQLLRQVKAAGIAGGIYPVLAQPASPSPGARPGASPNAKPKPSPNAAANRNQSAPSPRTRPARSPQSD